MGKHTLEPVSALQSAIGASTSGINVAEWTGLTIAHIAARKGAADALRLALERELGVRAGERPSACVANGVTAVWVGPDQWLVIANREAARDVEQELRAKFGQIASVSDQSDARVLVRLTGAKAQTALARAVGIDLHDRSFPPGAAAVTHAGHIGILLWRDSEGDGFVAGCSRSYAGSFWTWLTHACAEFGMHVHDAR